jgi:hypothetical protein
MKPNCFGSMTFSSRGFIYASVIMDKVGAKEIGLKSLLKVACGAGGIRGHERMGSLKYRLPKNDTF